MKLMKRWYILKKKLKTFFFKDCCTSKNQINDVYRLDLLTFRFLGRYAIGRENYKYRLHNFQKNAKSQIIFMTASGIS